MVDLEGYNLELNGADGSSQNGMAEHPNKVFAQTMHCTLPTSVQNTGRTLYD